MNIRFLLLLLLIPTAAACNSTEAIEEPPTQIAASPIEVLKERLQQRTGDIADATADLLESQIALAEAFTTVEQPYVQTLDTTKPIEPQLATIRA